MLRLTYISRAEPHPPPHNKPRQTSPPQFHPPSIKAPKSNEAILKTAHRPGRLKAPFPTASMGKNDPIPNAWDDDWEAQADRAAAEEKNKPPSPPTVLTKAERIAEHTESNRKLWQSAYVHLTSAKESYTNLRSESAETFHYLEASNTVPLANNFKSQVKVLSRKPVIAKRDPVTGLASLSLDDDDDAKKDAQPTIEEIRARQKKERDEKQRRYDEARAKIFGESAPSSRGSSPGTGTTTPPRQQGRGRGGRGGNQANRNVVAENRQFESRRQPAVQSGPPRELYDPNYMAKPESPRRRDDESMSPRPSTRDEGTPIRTQRGLDDS